MTNKNLTIDVDRIIKHWIETSEEDFKTMLTLYEAKSYSWALFIGHISTEKLLKALYVKRLKNMPHLLTTYIG